MLIRSFSLHVTAIDTIRDLSQMDGSKTQGDRITKKCRARLGMHSLVRPVCGRSLLVKENNGVVILVGMVR